ncbi:MAG: hypothetical protein GX891_03795 [Clostridiales bacterium]|nr:hypothetical protein [Clostridiales bacterium]
MKNNNKKKFKAPFEDEVYLKYLSEPDALGKGYFVSPFKDEYDSQALEAASHELEEIDIERIGEKERRADGAERSDEEIVPMSWEAVNDYTTGELKITPASFRFLSKRQHRVITPNLDTTKRTTKAQKRAATADKSLNAVKDTAVGESKIESKAVKELMVKELEKIRIRRNADSDEETAAEKQQNEAPAEAIKEAHPSRRSKRQEKQAPYYLSEDEYNSLFLPAELDYSGLPASEAKLVINTAVLLSPVDNSAKMIEKEEVMQAAAENKPQEVVTASLDKKEYEDKAVEADASVVNADLAEENKTEAALDVPAKIESADDIAVNDGEEKALALEDKGVTEEISEAIKESEAKETAEESEAILEPEIFSVEAAEAETAKEKVETVSKEAETDIKEQAKSAADEMATILSGFKEESGAQVKGEISKDDNISDMQKHIRDIMGNEDEQWFNEEDVGESGIVEAPLLAKLAKLPPIIDYFVSLNLKRQSYVKVAKFLLKAYGKYKDSPENVKYIKESMKKLIPCLMEK